MEDLSARIKTITRELRALQLNWPAFPGTNTNDQTRILNYLLDAGLGNDLKKAVDLLSQFLWCYIEAAAAGINAEGIDHAQQSVRLCQVTEMLRLLHHTACPLRESLAYIERTAMAVTLNAETTGANTTSTLEKSA